MTARPVTARSGARPRPRAAPRRPRGAARRRRAVALVVAALAAIGLVTALVAPLFKHAVQEIALPLRHEDIIRQQASAKGLDPALVAAVIYAESRFRDQTSPAGARGLMQLTPATAQYIARKSGGTAFQLRDLGTPQINIAYGSFYLRYLLHKYGGNELPAIAAYNAGEANVDRWISDASRRGKQLNDIASIPFPETRGYVARVLDARRQYRRQYAAELGLR